MSPRSDGWWAGGLDVCDAMEVEQQTSMKIQGTQKETLGIQSPKLRMVMEPKYYAFWRWLDTLIIIWEYDWIPRERDQCEKKHRFFRGELLNFQVPV